MTLVTSDGILLRSHEYSESSRIFRFLTPDLGIVSLIGKGVRKRGARGETPIQTFSEGSLTFLYRPSRDLHTLREFQPQEDSLALGRGIQRFFGASLVAELLLQYNLEEGDPALYRWVREVFLRLATVRESEVLGWTLSGGWRMLAQFGFPPRLSQCVRCDGALGGLGEEPVEELDRFDLSAGGLSCTECSADSSLPRVGPEARHDLALLVEGKPPLELRGEDAHISILEGYAMHHLEPRERFRSFATLRSTLSET